MLVAMLHAMLNAIQVLSRGVSSSPSYTPLPPLHPWGYSPVARPFADEAAARLAAAAATRRRPSWPLLRWAVSAPMPCLTTQEASTRRPPASP